jgi:hypothetical protein
MMLPVNMNNIAYKRGYTLLFAVLTATLVLGVAVFILSVSKKQFALSVTARESMFALYAADAGIECIVADEQRLSTGSHDIDCNKYQTTTDDAIRLVYIDLPYVDSGGIEHADAQQTSIVIPFADSSTHEVGEDQKIYGCAIVRIISYESSPDVVRTIIESRGYNICKKNSDDTYEPDISNPRIVERARQLIYE